MNDPPHGLGCDAAEGIAGRDAVTVTPAPQDASCFLVPCLAGVTHNVCIASGFTAETFAGRRYWAPCEAMLPLLQSPARPAGLC
jgi:hypothetical protein